MHGRAFAVLVSILLCDGCGYVGPVLPPSPQTPTPVTDLAAVERGDKIVVTFTSPSRTTDGVAITNFSSIDLRVSQQGQPPEVGRSYRVDVPPASDRDDPQPKPLVYTLPAADWSGQKISISVRTAAKKANHFSGWSKSAALEVVPALPRPVVQAAGSADGIVLSWSAVDGVQYRVQRQGPADKQPVELAVVNGGRYIDGTAAYDTQYRYVVTAAKSSAESLPSEEVTYSEVDKYPPATPSGLTALAGPDAVGLAWQRATEADLQGYYIYRSTNNGAYQRLGSVVTLPAFSDHDVEHGKTYSYKVSAIDKAGNESPQSNAVEAQF